MNKSESIAALASALNKAQGEIKAAEMNAVNPFLKNKYADLGAIIEASRPALVKNGLSFSQLVGGDSNTIRGSRRSSAIISSNFRDAGPAGI